MTIEKLEHDRDQVVAKIEDLEVQHDRALGDVEALTASIGKADPSDAKELEQLATQRHGRRAAIEALEGSLEANALEQKRIESELHELEVAKMRSEMEAEAAQAREQYAALETLVRSFAGQVHEQMAAIMTTVDGAGAKQRRLLPPGQELTLPATFGIPLFSPGGPVGHVAEIFQGALERALAEARREQLEKVRAS